MPPFFSKLSWKFTLMVTNIPVFCNILAFLISSLHMPQFDSMLVGVGFYKFIICLWQLKNV